MPLTGNGAGTDSSALTPQEATQLLSGLLDSVQDHCSIIAKEDAKSVRAVHQLRVDIRKTLAALQLFRELLPASEVAWFLRKLRQLRKLSSPVRDWDVLAKRLLRQARDRQAEQKTSQLLKRIARWMRSCRTERIEPLRQKARRLLRKGSFARHAASLMQDATVHGNVQSTGQLRIIANEFMESSTFKPRDLEAIHQFRLRAKSLRYAIEILQAQLPQIVANDLLSTFTDLQKNLGQINDQRFAWQGLKELSHQFSGRDRQCLERLSREARIELRANLKSLQELWTSAFQQRLRQQVESLFS